MRMRNQDRPSRVATPLAHLDITNSASRQEQTE
jgi:hypothetical protein